MNNQELNLSRNLLSKYKERLEKEILDRSKRLKIPKARFEEVLNKNEEIQTLTETLNKLDKNEPPSKPKKLGSNC